MKHINLKIFIKKLICILLCSCILTVHVSGFGNPNIPSSYGFMLDPLPVHKDDPTPPRPPHPSKPPMPWSDPERSPPHNNHHDESAHKIIAGVDNKGKIIARIIADDPENMTAGSGANAFMTTEYIRELMNDSVEMTKTINYGFTHDQIEQLKLGMATVVVRVILTNPDECNLDPSNQPIFIELTQENQDNRPSLPSQIKVSEKQSTINYTQDPATPVIIGSPATQTMLPNVIEIKNDGGAGQEGQGIVGTTATTLPNGAIIKFHSYNTRGLPSFHDVTLSKTDTDSQIIKKIQKQTRLWANGFSKDANDLSAKAEATSAKINALINSQINTSNAIATKIIMDIAPPAWMDNIPDSSVPKNYLPETQIKYPGAYFETDANTSFGQELQDADRYIRKTRDNVNSSSNIDPSDVKNIKNSMLDVAEINIALADIAYIEGNQQEAKEHLEMALKITDTVLDFVPGISLVKDIVSLTTGVNPITGETLSATELSFIAVGLFVPSAFSATGKRFEKLASNFSKIVANSERFKKFRQDIKNMSDYVPGFLKRTKVDISKYVGDAGIAATRWGDYVVKALPDLLKDREIVRILDKWGVSSIEKKKGGGNQLLEHLFTKKYATRMKRIEDDMGFATDTITDAFNKKDLISMKRGIKALDEVVNHIKTNSVVFPPKIEGDRIKKFYFKNPLPNGDNKGLLVIETNGKINTVFDADVTYLEQIMKLK